jgi:hypothetical protein
VLRCLVRLGLEEVAAASAAPATQPRQQKAAAEGAAGGEPAGAAAALHAALSRLGQWLHLASQRIAALGLEAFVGAGEAHASEHVSWLANAAWNAGLDAAGRYGPAPGLNQLGRVAVGTDLRRGCGQGALPQHRQASTLANKPPP